MLNLTKPIKEIKKNEITTTTVEYPKIFEVANQHLIIENHKNAPEINSKPSQNNELTNLLRLGGCNIYGQMYNVNDIIEELSDNCTACKCTNTGVQCSNTNCK